VLGRKFILKMFRRVGEGENPDLEIGRFLTEQKRLACAPKLAGALKYRDKSGDRFTLAVLHEYVPNQGDAWVYTLDEINRYLERIESELSGPPPNDALATGISFVDLAEQVAPASARDVIGPYLPSAELLGKRTAEMHLALAAGAEKSFAPEPFTKLYQRSLYQSMRAHARRTLRLLHKQAMTLPETTARLADRLLQNEAILLARYADVAEHRITTLRTRCHGDFHLGQVLFTGNDFVIIDFEGEPDRSISERRIKRSPLRDVASMIRSFHYASHAEIRGTQRESMSPVSGDDVRAWLDVWYLWSAASYLKAYLAEASQGRFLPDHRDELQTLLCGYLLEEAVHELGFELNNRPDWVRIPLEGILQLLGTK
jgi:maltose alpha-D-glucosyltransferase / alpha-amylase